ncbi:HEAT repeat domain-containing protein [Bythopirellula polymerisocia]|uniref:HEAT repeat protein n=1 Tax=Bythopirellula polymerisocia TaxID=2528003 RepID=A0A5C6CIL4_9BACT|nr:HEAT repeat domain-containing protein [Bythopirellula polymerisocia]TWU22589.1 HEAT repeat protein [Bythopirellula polymerisocia]
MVNLFSGCSTTLPWQKKEYTSIITPAMRVSAIRESASRATTVDSMEQTRLVEELAMQIRTEGDPLVRAAIQESLGDMEVPLARDVLIAGLNDDDLNVRLVCCQKLGNRGEPENVPILRGILEGGEVLDVKLAATDALGQIRSTESVKCLAIALKDRDPALQYAGVEALKQLSGQDFGNDVAAWQQYAEAGQLTEKRELSVADRVIQMSPF